MPFLRGVAARCTQTRLPMPLGIPCLVPHGQRPRHCTASRTIHSRWQLQHILCEDSKLQALQATLRTDQCQSGAWGDLTSASSLVTAITVSSQASERKAISALEILHYQMLMDVLLHGFRSTLSSESNKRENASCPNLRFRGTQKVRKPRSYQQGIEHRTFGMIRSTWLTMRRQPAHLQGSLRD
eukprot:jgi/Mesvir1/27018/Mv25921-RA.1